MTEQDRFEDFVKTAINELDPSPVIPRDEMWSRIDQARRFRRGRQAETRRINWVAWPVGLAAMLAIGIGLGRWSVGLSAPESFSSGSPIAQAPANTATRSTAMDANTGAYGAAARQHFSRAEMLLTAVSSGTVDPQLRTWANEMLIGTRLLLDSPAGSDPAMSKLLEDLELLLAQIAAQTAPSRMQSELDLIQHGIKETDVLPRLRAAQPNSRIAAGT